MSEIMERVGVMFREEVARATIRQLLTSAICVAREAGYSVVFEPGPEPLFRFDPLTIAPVSPVIAPEVKPAQIALAVPKRGVEALVSKTEATDSKIETRKPEVLIADRKPGKKYCRACGGERKKLLINGPQAGMCLGCAFKAKKKVS